MSDTTTPWLTAKEAAARARCGTKLIYTAISASRLRVSRRGVAGRNIVTRAEWVDAWLESTAQPVEVRPRRTA